MEIIDIQETYLLHKLLSEFLICWQKSGELGALPRDLCKITLGLERKSAVSGNSIGDRLVGEPADIGPWLGEFGLGKAPRKLKKRKEIGMYVSMYIFIVYFGVFIKNIFPL